MLSQDTERWLSVEEIAAHLGISKETIYRWVEREKIPAHRVGRQWKFKASEVDQWIMTGGAATLDKKQGQQNG
ncbi:MAG: helix-turn-helix domain-containing protein [Bdellovibrionaceae bacterium]|nr:helix-turn-helix domain-containing protein [Pseudobdellovibrionaceae bacterium]